MKWYSFGSRELKFVRKPVFGVLRPVKRGISMCISFSMIEAVNTSTLESFLPIESPDSEGSDQTTRVSQTDLILRLQDSFDVQLWVNNRMTKTAKWTIIFSHSRGSVSQNYQRQHEYWLQSINFVIHLAIDFVTSCMQFSERLLALKRLDTLGGFFSHAMLTHFQCHGI